MKKLSLAAAMVAAVALSLGWTASAGACPGSTKSTASKAKAPRGAASVVIAVKGMTCGGCAGRIASELRSLGGVYTAKVDLASKQARVEFQPSKITVAKLVEAVRKLGYEASALRKG